jgi:catechol 2,3-dioxygenase-like lactoylglutathione lyase family enzyme
MMHRISHITFVVRNYDEAIAFFTQKLGFELIEDVPMENGKRWVLVGTSKSDGTTLLLAEAKTPGQISRIGNQTGGRVFLFLETDNFRSDYNAMKERGVKFLEEPREEAYGTVAVFEDLYGNKWDLLQRR